MSDTSPALTEEVEYDEDPRWVYDMTMEQARRAWPCGTCGTRRDEHADQSDVSAFPSLDITDHEFVEVFTLSQTISNGE